MVKLIVFIAILIAELMKKYRKKTFRSFFWTEQRYISS